MKLYQVDRPRKPKFYVEADNEIDAHEIAKDIIKYDNPREAYYLTQVMENTAVLHYAMPESTPVSLQFFGLINSKG